MGISEIAYCPKTSRATNTTSVFCLRGPDSNVLDALEACFAQKCSRRERIEVGFALENPFFGTPATAG